MADERLLEMAQPWIENQLGVPLSQMSGDSTPVVPIGTEAHGPLRGLKIGERTIVACRSEWVDRLQVIVDDLDPDLLFSMFGAYELARVTLRDDVGIWGPSWYLFGDEQTWRPLKDDRVVMLGPEELKGVDYRFFWHCDPGALAGFAILRRRPTDRPRERLGRGRRRVGDRHGRRTGRQAERAWAARWSAPRRAGYWTTGSSSSRRPRSSMCRRHGLSGRSACATS